jgi:hypothetical protein
MRSSPFAALLKLLAVLFLLIWTPNPCTATPILAADQPVPTEITINRVSTSGSGCPRRAVSTDISEDRTVVTLGFNEFQTYFGRGRRNEDKDKNCNIRLNLKYPGGYTYAVVETTYHGFAQLDAGVTGNLAATYSFSDAAGGRRNDLRDTESQTSIVGGGIWANGGVYTKQDVVPAERRVRSPCGQSVNLLIRTRLNLSSTNESASGVLTDDDATIAFTQQVHIGWEKCTK